MPPSSPFQKLRDPIPLLKRPSDRTFPQRRSHIQTDRTLPQRRLTFDQVGGISPHSGLAADYDLCLRLSEVTEVYHLPRPLYYYRIHPHNTSQKRQLEIITDFQAAVERALQRRGLADRFQLVVQVMQRDGYLNSRFAIQKQGDDYG